MSFSEKTELTVQAATHYHYYIVSESLIFQVKYYWPLYRSANYTITCNIHLCNMMMATE